MRKLIVSIAVIGMMGIFPVYAQQAQSATSVAPVTPKSWADSVTVKGDIRYRYESINDDSKLDANNETYERQRDRIRARVDVESKMSDTLKAGIGFSTGQSDPVSGNQTLGDGFNKKDMKLNLAYFDWTLVNQDPNLLSLVGGKMKNPFICVSDLVWDGDLTPEGLAAKGQFTLGDAVTFLANGGYLWVQERSTGNDDTKLYAGQGAVKFQPVPEFYLMLGGSCYQYDNMENYQVLDWEAKNNAYGNSTVNGAISGGTTNKNYKYDYQPIELFAEIGLFIGRLPITLYGQTVSNSEADDNKNGQLYGVSFGKAKNPNSCEAGYRYAKLEKDATVGAYTDSDRWGGGTDGEGSKIYGKYQIAKNFQIGASYFMDTKKISDPSKETDYNRLQVDLVFNF
jgi:hypothetical protein